MFTTKSQYNEYNEYLIKTASEKETLNSEDIKILVDIFEGLTEFNNIFSLTKKLFYIITTEFEKIYKELKIPISITDTDEEKKIKFYRNIIKNTYDNIKETIGIYEKDTTKKVYYYEFE